MGISSISSSSRKQTNNYNDLFVDEAYQRYNTNSNNNNNRILRQHDFVNNNNRFNLSARLSSIRENSIEEGPPQSPSSPKATTKYHSDDHFDSIETAKSDDEN